MPDKKKKHTKKIIAISSETGYDEMLRGKAIQITALEKQLAGMNAMGWLNGDAVKLMAEVDQALLQYKTIMQADRVHMPDGSDTKKKKEYYYRQVALPMLAYLEAYNIPRKNALYVISQSINELGFPPYTGDNKTMFDGYADFGKKEYHNNNASAKNIQTKEYNNETHSLETTQANFSTYDNPYLAIAKQISYIHNNYPEADAVLNDTSANSSIKKFATGLHPSEQGGYSTDTGYVNKLTKIYTTALNDVATDVVPDEMLVAKILYKKYTDSVAVVQGKNTTDLPNHSKGDLTFLMGRGIPGDSDYVPSIFDADKYTFNGPSGKWIPKNEHTNSRTQTPAPAKHSKAATPAPKQKATGAHPTGFNIIIKKVIGQMVGEQQVSSGERKPLTAAAVAGLLRKAVQSNMV